jgi:hypothetical protein
MMTDQDKENLALVIRSELEAQYGKPTVMPTMKMCLALSLIVNAGLLFSVYTTYDAFTRCLELAQ